MGCFAWGPAFADELASEGPSALSGRSLEVSNPHTRITCFWRPRITVGDVYWTPDFTVRADGKLTSDYYYRLYARAEFDAFTEESDADNAVARVGARLASNVFDWTATVGYENRYSYAGVFEERLFTGHDLITTLWRTIDFNGVSLSPGALLTYRFADVDESAALPL